MINEYALDPALLGTWEEVRYYLDKFGLDQGRLLAPYPSARMWSASVMERFPSPAPPALVMTRKRVETRLQQAVAAFAASRFGARWNPALPWLTNAEQEHLLRAFHAIVARENPTKRPHLIATDEINEESPPQLWRVERSREVARRGEDMARAVAPLFRLARTVLFVDRNFSPLDTGFRCGLAAFLTQLRDCGRGPAGLRVEYHTGDRGTNARTHLLSADFVRSCQSILPAAIPAGMRVRFVRWRYSELHDRYLVIDRLADGGRVGYAAVTFGQGLDEAGLKEDAQTVRLTLLDTVAAGKLYQDFLGPKPTHTSDPGSTVDVIGTRPG